ncbi:MAG: 30S ribosomal protein S16 [Alphaproteobacteria bacterium]|nr:30S ribosomal protein S16 [Alphaproteobacteria bacterium]
MSVKIRMTRAGAKKRPFFRIIVTDTRSSRDGRFIERVGTFDPLLPKTEAKRVTLDVDRIKHWLSKGALPSERVAKLLGAAEIIPMPRRRNNPEKALPKKKAQERAKATAAAAAAAPVASS